jgi:hypothetical protein
MMDPEGPAGAPESETDMTDTQTAARPASRAQFDLIKGLLARKALDEALDGDVEFARRKATYGALTSREASDLIDRLIAAPARGVPEGMHVTPEGTVYKVQRAVHGSGRLYAKALVPDGVGRDWKFMYVAGGLALLSADTYMTLDQAREFGALYGTCAACGRTLTDEKSIAAGVGPVCAEKF